MPALAPSGVPDPVRSTVRTRGWVAGPASQWLAGHRLDSGPGRVHPGQVVPRALRRTPRSRSRPPAPCGASSGSARSGVATHRPPGGSREPKTKVTSTRSASSQIGHCSPEGRPRLRAARSSSGWASQTSRRESRPFRNSRTTALRASRYSTRPPVGEVCTPSSAPGRKLTAAKGNPSPVTDDSRPTPVTCPAGSAAGGPTGRPGRCPCRADMIALIYRSDISLQVCSW